MKRRTAQTGSLCYNKETFSIRNGITMKKWKYWAPPLLYMILIFIVSSLEQPPFPPPKFEWIGIDKLLHFIEYSILSVLLTIAFVNASPTWFPARWIWVTAALISILYGASDEIHQYFVPGRFATIADWVSDVIGAIAGVACVYFYYKRKKERN